MYLSKKISTFELHYKWEAYTAAGRHFGRQNRFHNDKFTDLLKYADLKYIFIFTL